MDKMIKCSPKPFNLKRFVFAGLPKSMMETEDVSCECELLVTLLANHHHYYELEKISLLPST